MGITGLLPFLKPASHQTNIRQYSGCTVAVDTYCWLHKGAFSCADKLAKGEETDSYVIYCMKMVNSLLAVGIKPIMVFDGQNLPSKSVTEKKRHEERQIQKRKGKNFLIEGKLKEARESFQRCTEVTAEMALNLIKACRKIGVDCIVAPYEADAQLAYLNKIGVAQIIITEDSDLVLFGCEKIMYKMDINGNGIMVEKSRIKDCFGNFATNFTFDKFRYMCIMSGCDYLPSLSGIGLKKAIRFFSKTVNPNLRVVLAKIPSYLNLPNVIVTNDYIEKFIQANNTFLYQLVFDPLKRKVVPLTPYPNDIEPEELTYAGPRISNEQGFQIALGNINTDTNKAMDNYDPDLNYVPPKSTSWFSGSSLKAHSIWDPNYVVSSSKLTVVPQPIAKNKITNSKTFPETTNRKRQLDEDQNMGYVGVTKEELFSMYSHEQPATKIRRSLSTDDANNTEETKKPLPTLTCSSYFAKVSESSSAPPSIDIPENVNASSEKRISVSSQDESSSSLLTQLSKSTTSLKFDESLSTLNPVKQKSPAESKTSIVTQKFGAKYQELFQRYGYNVNQRLTLSPLNHTSFKPVFAKSVNDAVDVPPTSDNESSCSQSQGDVSQTDSLILGGSIDQESFDSHVGSQSSENEISSQKFNSMHLTPSISGSRSTVKKTNNCKFPGLSKRRSINFPIQHSDSKRQLSIKETLEKFEFIKKRNPFSPSPVI